MNLARAYHIPGVYQRIIGVAHKLEYSHIMFMCSSAKEFLTLVFWVFVVGSLGVTCAISADNDVSRSMREIVKVPHIWDKKYHCIVRDDRDNNKILLPLNTHTHNLVQRSRLGVYRVILFYIEERSVFRKLYKLTVFKICFLHSYTTKSLEMNF